MDAWLTSNLFIWFDIFFVARIKISFLKLSGHRFFRCYLVERLFGIFVIFRMDSAVYSIVESQLEQSALIKFGADYSTAVRFFWSRLAFLSTLEEKS